jgi:photosystem II reaction center protein PsbM
MQHQFFYKVKNTMEVNILGLIAVLLFVLIPTSFLLILYVKNYRECRKLITFLFEKIILILTQFYR